MKKNKIISLIISGSVCFSVLFLWWLGSLDGLENKVMNSKFKLRGKIATVKDVVIVAVDEESIKQLGRWPWQRSVHGRLIDVLDKAGAKAIVFDILFTEADKDRPWADEYLGRVAKKSGKVVFGSFFKGVTAEGVFVDAVLPINFIKENSKTGFTNISTEIDGVNRKVRLLTEYENKTMPSLSVAGLVLYLNKSPEDIVREKKVVLDEYNEMMVNFAGGYESFQYYPYYKVLSGEMPQDNFKDKIVLVGGTATGLFDVKAIPFVPNFPGVEIHANAISNILLNNYLKPWPVLFTFLLIIIFSIIAGMVFGQLAPWKGGVTTTVLFASYFIVVYYLFKLKYIQAEFVAPALSMSMSYIGVLFYRFMTEEKEKRWIKKSFNQYLSPQILENILSNPAALKLGGERQELSILFSDIRGFTTISEGLKPEEVVELLNEYLSKMVEVVFRNQGTMDKFIGDAVMAFWGAPVAQKDHARKAVNCAIDMIDEVIKLQAKWKQEGKTNIRIGIGINSGDVIVGNMGSNEKMDYTVIGDNVNLASRLEGLTKDFKTQIVISEFTYELVKEFFDAEPLGAVKVKGKAKSVNIYGVMGRKGEARQIQQILAEGDDGSKEDSRKSQKKIEFDPTERVYIQKEK